MRIRLESMWLPKHGSRIEECEDAFWPRWSGTRDLGRVHLAIADGATEGSFSKLWAGMLVRSYGYERSPITAENVRRRVERRCMEWNRQTAQLPVAWYALEKLRQGALSTLLGVTLDLSQKSSDRGGTWSALAIGDSCLFQVRENELVTALPLRRAHEFGFQPRLVSSVPSKNSGLWSEITSLEHAGTWLEGDLLLLMTDAIAAWFLSECELGEMPWKRLQELASLPRPLSMNFSDFVMEMRQAGRMRNDDVTVLAVEVVQR